jgi:hypothetical protein
MFRSDYKRHVRHIEAPEIIFLNKNDIIRKYGASNKRRQFYDPKTVCKLDILQAHGNIIKKRQ